MPPPPEPPLVAEAPPPPPISLAEDREECVFETIERILKRVDRHIDEQLQFASLTRVAAGSLLEDCLQLVDQSFVEREQVSIVGALDARWLPEAEPQRVVIDSWARGALPVKLRSAAELAAQQAAAAEQPATRRSAPASRSSALASRRESANSDLLTARPSTGDKERERDKDALSRRQLMMSSSRKEKQQNVKKLTAEEMDLEQRLREEVQARRVAQEYRKRQDEQDRRAAAQLDKLRAELQGKPYGYDHRGQPIVMQGVNADSLPTWTPALRVKLSDGLAEAALNAQGSQATVGSNADRARAGGGKGAGARKQAVQAVRAPDFIPSTERGPPPIAENIRLAAGVTLREGQVVRAGPRFDPGNRPTKSELANTSAGKDEGSGGADGPRAGSGARGPKAVIAATAGAGGDAAAQRGRSRGGRSPPRARGGLGATLAPLQGVAGAGGGADEMNRTAPAALGRSLRPEKLVGGVLPGKSLPRAHEIPMTRSGMFRTERPEAAAHRLRDDSLSGTIPTIGMT